MSFPIESIVQVNIDRITKLPTRVGFGTPAILDINTAQPNDVDEFTELQGLLDAGFTTSDEAYKCAAALFSQSPRPESVKVLKRASNVAQVNNVDVTGNDDGTYGITLNGTEFTFVASSNTAGEIRDGLVSAINGGSEPVTAAPGAGDSLDLTSDTAGLGFSVVLSQNPSDNMVLTTTTPNTGPASELARIRQIDDDFYFLLTTDRSALAIGQLEDAVESLTKIFAYDTDEADSRDLAPASDTTSLLATTKAKNLDRTFPLWGADLDSYPAASLVGKVAPKDPGSVTWKFKNLSGVVADDDLTTTQKQNILDKNGNTYTTVGGIAITEEGTVGSGEFIDIIRGTDWIQARIQENVYFLLANEDKVPFDNGGIEAVALRVEEILQQAVDRTILRGGDDAPIVTVPDIGDVPIADRAARELNDVEFEGYYAGAIHKVKIEGRLSV